MIVLYGFDMKLKEGIMARVGITYEQVEHAITLLTAERIKPTITAIREKLGTGSPNTILQHLQKWRDAQPVKPVQAFIVPTAIVDAIAQVVEQAEAKAKGAVHEELLESRAELVQVQNELRLAEEQLQSVQNEFDQAKKVQAQAETVAVESKAKVENLESQLTAINEKLKAETIAKELLTVDLAKAQIKAEGVAELKKQVKELQSLKVELARAQATLDAQQKELDTLRAMQQQRLKKQDRIESARQRHLL
jgi:archaellum component FlaC